MTPKRSLFGIALGVAVALLAARTVLTSDRAARPAASHAASAALTPTARIAAKRLYGVAPTGAADALPTPTPLDCASGQGVAATVNDRPISVARVCERLRFLTGATSPAAGRQVLEQLVEAELVSSALEDRGMSVTEGDLDAELRTLDPDAAGASQAASSDVARSELRASARERVARRMLVDALGQLEPSAADLRAVVSRSKVIATVDAWIARLPGNASDDASAKVRANANAGLDRLRQGADPSREGLARLPSFELTQGSGEPALDAALFAPGGSDWQAPVRTRAGWVVARAVSVQRVQSGAEQDDPRRAALARVRHSEERRILDDLRAAAAIVRYVQ